MKTAALIFLLLFAIQFAPAQNQTTKRNLSSYDNGGEYKVAFDISDTQRAAEADKVRGFIWEHLKNKNLGFIKLTLYNRAGDPYQTTYYAEPGSGGKWVISFEVWGSQKNNGPGKVREFTSSGVYDSIDRIEKARRSSNDEEENAGRPDPAGIPLREERKPATYYLRMKAKTAAQYTYL